MLRLGVHPLYRPEVVKHSGQGLLSHVRSNRGAPFTNGLASSPSGLGSKE